MRYVIEGRVIPERAQLNVPEVHFQIAIVNVNDPIDVRILIIGSRIFVYIATDIDLSFPDIRNVISTAVGNVINYIGYKGVFSYSFEIESIIDIKNGITQVLGSEGFAFDSSSSLDDALTFRKARAGDSIFVAVTPVISSRLR